ncbi:hypothetical protein XENOCAPTIV_015715, partial [Xenoophorus captivus]
DIFCFFVMKKNLSCLSGGGRMSVEVDLLLQEAKESIEAAQNYRSELQQRLHGLNQARKQIRGSSGQAREALKRHFTELQTAASRLLSERLAGLLAEVDAIEADSIKPLDDCQSLIEHGVGQADELLREALVDVPCVSAQLDDSILSLLRDRVSRHGSVSSHPPVQIEELQERPGSILVRWCKVSMGNDRNWDFVYGNVKELLSKLSRDYRTEGYILSSRKNIALRNDSSQSRCTVLYSNAPTYFCGQTLTFKISAAGQFDRLDSLGVCIDTQSGEESLQRDQAVCISTNGRLILHLLRVKYKKKRQGRSLSWNDSSLLHVDVPLPFPGAVFVNGKEMTNQLPAITMGSAVTFDMEVVNLLPISNNNLSEGGHFKLRVTIGSGNREVVFDWLVDQAVDCLFFGCSFVHSGWKVLVF